MPTAAYGIGGWQLTGTALAGGLVFGLGAAINGGCAYSTMTRLVDGEVRMAASIGGLSVGIFTFLALVDLQWLTRPAPALLGSVLAFALLISAAWASYELPRIWRLRPKDMRLKHMVLPPQYRLSSAALLIGIASTAIFLLVRSPGYTITLQNLLQGVVGRDALPAAMWVFLLLAVLAGMLASTLQRGSFRLDWRPRWSWLRNIFGGALMGIGTAMLPGGNDALVLWHSEFLAACAAGLWRAADRRRGRRRRDEISRRIDMRVVSSDDIYRTERQPRGSILNSHPPRHN